jgi:inosine/xanthosine triphosphate pyrophosphatase family protein
MSPRHRVVYVTSSEYKKEENRIFHQGAKFADGINVSDLFEFELRALNVPERLLIDIDAMVRSEVVHAYRAIRVPCLVEHAGLVFRGVAEGSYPGGLTKPMWNALKPNFVSQTNSAGREVIARAVVAYCDGKRIHTFVGEVAGVLAQEPRGARDFYWDNVFVPSTATGLAAGLTYAEIVEDERLGLEHKVLELSQSSIAMLNCLEYLRREGTPSLWR